MCLKKETSQVLKQGNLDKNYNLRPSQDYSLEFKLSEKVTINLNFYTSWGVTLICRGQGHHLCNINSILLENWTSSCGYMFSFTLYKYAPGKVLFVRTKQSFWHTMNGSQMTLSWPSYNRRQLLKFILEPSYLWNNSWQKVGTLAEIYKHLTLSGLIISNLPGPSKSGIVFQSWSHPKSNI